MESVIISIRPEWVAKILNGEKIGELRKTVPNRKLPIDGYIYCTKGKRRLVLTKENYAFFGSSCIAGDIDLNGMVVAKFTLRSVEKVIARDWGGIKPMIVYEPESMRAMCILKEETCLNYDQINSYLDGSDGYVWYISDLVIFDKPQELSEFGVKRAPQSWCYVKEENDA